MVALTVRGNSKHPHARGEDVPSTGAALAMKETPPRTWGRREPVIAALADHGNTPTHVGKTNGIPYAVHYYRKHPHARGEDSGEAYHRLTLPETPPRTWGRLIRELEALHGFGNTPTHVGKTDP